MGSPANEPCHTDKEKQKQINFEKEFFIGKYEITQGQYVTVMGNNPSVEIGDKLPVHNVSWSDAQKFCEKSQIQNRERQRKYREKHKSEIEKSNVNVTLSNAEEEHLF